jgi:hypothetical protein
VRINATRIGTPAAKSNGRSRSRDSHSAILTLLHVGGYVRPIVILPLALDMFENPQPGRTAVRADFNRGGVETRDAGIQLSKRRVKQYSVGVRAIRRHPELCTHRMLGIAAKREPCFSADSSVGGVRRRCWRAPQEPSDLMCDAMTRLQHQNRAALAHVMRRCRDGDFLEQSNELRTKFGESGERIDGASTTVL